LHRGWGIVGQLSDCQLLKKEFFLWVMFRKRPAGSKYRPRNFIDVVTSSSVCFRIYCFCYHWSRDSVLYIQTKLRAGKPGALVWIPAETRYYTSQQSARNISSAYPGSCWMGYGGYCRRYSSPSLKLNTRLLLVLRLRVSGAMPIVIIWFHGLHNDDFTFRGLGSIVNKPFGAVIIFLILAHSVYNIWIMQEPNMLELWNKLHFEEKKTESVYYV